MATSAAMIAGSLPDSVCVMVVAYFPDADFIARFQAFSQEKLNFVMDNMQRYLVDDARFIVAPVATSGRRSLFMSDSGWLKISRGRFERICSASQNRSGTTVFQTAWVTSERGLRQWRRKKMN